ncbi:MAG: beta-ketoacyl-[acyl-carrier-protein] synthase family protein [Segniliparus sp.]|uniref:beta-ketoacyl-[acyl-carrier-protein] synthase family protein n=1 Tax=Segniliparus sp. TaxID=2804064 RepID=UPI003F2E745C
MSNRVLVTGLGVICGLGLDWQTMWDGLTTGRSAIREWSPPGVPDFPVRYAAPVDDRAFAERHSDLRAGPNGSWGEKPADRRTRFGFAAAQQAFEDAGALEAASLGKVGVAVGSGVPDYDALSIARAAGDGAASWDLLFERRGELDRSSGPLATIDRLATGVAEHFGLTGPVLNFNTACSSAAHAIGHGFRMVRRGEADAMLVGGADSVLDMVTMVQLHMLGAPSLSTSFGDRLCRAFDRDRSGLVAGEGSAMVLLESEASALARGARVHGEIAGFGSSLDAHQVTAPHPQGEGAALAMRRALADARTAPSDVGYVNAHGTSTPLNDTAETAAIKTVFRQDEHYRSLAVSSNKTMFGHLIAASGAPELVATVLTVRDGVIPPTLNLENPDPACDLDYVPGAARKADVPVAISNSFGFGGLNSSLVVRRYEN